MKTTAGLLSASAALLAVVASLPAHAAAPASASSTAPLVALLRAGAQTAPAPVTKANTASTLPDGPGKAEAERVCSACHAPNVFTHQRHDKAGWSTIINQMIAKGADGSDDDFAKILDYLVTNFNPSVPVPPTGAPAPKPSH